MTPKLTKSYSIAYSIAMVFILLIPVLLYIKRFDLTSIRDINISFLNSLTTWSGISILCWLAGLFLSSMTIYWELYDSKFTSSGISLQKRLQALWIMAFMPALIGFLLAFYTFVSKPDINEKYLGLKLLAIFLGFYPVAVYALLKARQYTMAHSAMDSRIVPPIEIPKYLKSKKWMVIIFIVTCVLSSWIGAIVTIGYISYFRRGYKYRYILYLFLFVFGMYVTWLEEPIINHMKLVHVNQALGFQAFAFHITYALFSSVFYICIIKIILLFRSESVKTS